MTQSQGRPVAPPGPRFSDLMSSYLSLHHRPEHLAAYVAAFKKKFPTVDDAIRDFRPEMLATEPDLQGPPFSATPQLKAQFIDDFSRLSVVQKQLMKEIHICNYYSPNPRPMIFRSGPTDVAGGEVLMGMTAMENQGGESIVVTVLCEKT